MSPKREGNPNQKTGTRFEYSARDKARKAGLPTERQMLSGAHKDFPGDLIIAEKIIGECKLRTATILKCGDKSISIHLSWFDQVEAQAKAKKMDFGLLLVKPKGTRKTLAIMDADKLFAILSRIY
jgi:hypothetical protein